MINELIKLATHFDAKGLKKEADYLDMVIKQAAPSPSFYDAEGNRVRADGAEPTRHVGQPEDGEISSIWMEIANIKQSIHYLQSGLNSADEDIKTLWGDKPRPR